MVPAGGRGGWSGVRAHSRTLKATKVLSSVGGEESLPDLESNSQEVPQKEAAPDREGAQEELPEQGADEMQVHESEASPADAGVTPMVPAGGRGGWSGVRAHSRTLKATKVLSSVGGEESLPEKAEVRSGLGQRSGGGSESSQGGTPRDNGESGHESVSETASQVSRSPPSSEIAPHEEPMEVCELQPPPRVSLWAKHKKRRGTSVQTAREEAKADTAPVGAASSATLDSEASLQGLSLGLGSTPGRGLGSIDPSPRLGIGASEQTVSPLPSAQTEACVSTPAAPSTADPKPPRSRLAAAVANFESRREARKDVLHSKGKSQASLSTKASDKTSFVDKESSAVHGAWKQLHAGRLYATLRSQMRDQGMTLQLTGSSPPEKTLDPTYDAVPSQ